MNFLVVSRISIPAKDRTLPAWEYLRSLGHTVTVEHPDSIAPTGSWKPDVIISMGITVMEETFHALEHWPKARLYCYNWDVYAWIWEPGQEGKKQAYHACRGKEYDYLRYGELLKRATEVWVPSRCTGRRTTQWYGLENWSVILSACPWWDYDRLCPDCQGKGEGPEYAPDSVPVVCDACRGTGKVSGARDDGYALMCLREIPDPWWGIFERTCEKLGIPYRCTRHEVSYEEYQDAVAGCRFICAPLYELSTGGLSLMEAYRLGKPVLISDSEWNGGRDYFGDRACYFDHGSELDFAEALSEMYEHPIIQPPSYSKNYIETNFSDKRMVDDILRRIECTSRK